MGLFPLFFSLYFGWLTIARIYGVFGEFFEPLHPVYIFHFPFTVVHETSTFEDDFVGLGFIDQIANSSKLP